MKGQGLWLIGEFDGTAERTVAPKEGGKQFTPFTNELIRVVVSDEPRSVQYREGKRPDCSAFVEGDLIAIPVRVRDVYQGVAQFDGRSLPVEAV